MNIDSLITGMQPPSYSDDVRARDVIPGNKRSITSARDFVSSLQQSVSGKRFRGDGMVAGLRSAVPDALARGLRVVNTGFSTTDAQTDEIITQLVFARPYAQGWEQGFIAKTPLFCSRQDANFGVPGLYTVADVPVLNFMLELGSLLDQEQQAVVERGAIVTELSNLADQFKPHTASTAQEWRNRWNWLGPMTTFQDAGPHSSIEGERRVQGAERMLGYSVYNRALTFNLFAPDLHRGDNLYWVCREYDMSDAQHFVDPTGEAIVARASGARAQALQVRGMSCRTCPFPPPSTRYAPTTGPDSIADPNASDADYVRRYKAAARWREYVPNGRDELTNEVRFREADEVSEEVRNMPDHVYEEYMLGTVIRVGRVRYLEGRNPTTRQILAAHRDQSKMKLLQTVEIYKGL